MQLTPREFDKLLIYMMAEVALKRKAKGIKLNHPEAVAIISAQRARRCARRQDHRGSHDGGAHGPHQGRRDGRRRRPRFRWCRSRPCSPTAAVSSPCTRRSNERQPRSAPWPKSKPVPAIAADVDPATGEGRRRRLRLPPGADRLPRGHAGDDAQGAQHRRPADPGRLALPFLRSQSRARVRPRRGIRPASRHPGVDRAALRAR